MEPLTNREDEVYEAIVVYVASYHNFPTHRWLVNHTRLSSTSMAAHYLKNLVRKKYLIKKKVDYKHEYVVNNSSWITPTYVADAFFAMGDPEETIKLEIVNSQGEQDRHEQNEQEISNRSKD